MSLKSLLQVLCGRFYSRQNSAEIAGLAAPSEKNTAISLGGGDSVVIVSPANGFLTVYSSGGSSRELKIYSEPENTGVSIGFNLESTSGGYTFAPVRKGQTLRVWGKGLDLSRCSARVHEFVGGGAKTLIHLLQKGGGQCLCLSSSFKVLSKRLFLWSIQAQTKFPRALQVIAKRLSLRLMDLLSSLRVIYLTSTRSTLRTTGYKVLSRRISMRGDALGYHVERDSQSPSRRTDLRFPVSDLLKHNFGKFEFSANEQEVTYGLA